MTVSIKGIRVLIADPEPDDEDRLVATSTNGLECDTWPARVPSDFKSRDERYAWLGSKAREHRCHVVVSCGVLIDQDEESCLTSIYS